RRVRPPAPSGALEVAFRGRVLAAAVCVCALTTGACGGAHPARRTTPTRSAIAAAQATHERPSPPPRPGTAPGGAVTPAQAVRRFATAYINWDAQTVSGRMQALAADSVGQARSAMTLAAAQTADDYELRQGGISNSGTVEAVAPLSGHADDYVVVTRE